MRAESDDELMRRTQGGDLDALGALFDRHQPRLYGFLYRLVGEAATAEDLAQEAFWRLWRHRASYDGRRGFAPWLFAIARHLAFSELKKPHRRAISLSEETFLTAGRSGYGGCAVSVADAVATAVTLREPVRAALDALPQDQRVCILLREYEQWSHHDIAGVLGCSEGKVRVIAHRARQALKKRLQPLLED